MTIYTGIAQHMKHVDITDCLDCVNCEITSLFHTERPFDYQAEAHRWEADGYNVTLQVGNLFYETEETPGAKCTKCSGKLPHNPIEWIGDRQGYMFCSEECADSF